MSRTDGVAACVAPSNEEFRALWEEHSGHPEDFAAAVLERWGGWPEGVLGTGGTAGVDLPDGAKHG